MESSFITIISIFISLCTFIFTVYKFKKQKKWNSELEKLKYTFEHNLTSYKIYIELKHKRIIKVNQCMIEAYSAVVNLSSPFQTYPDFSTYTMIQISNFLDKISLGENEKDNIMSHWDSNREYAIKEVVYWYNRYRCKKASKLVNKLKRHILYVRLYIKEDDFRSLFEFTHKLDSILIHNETLLDEIRGRSFDNHDLNRDIQSMVEEASILNDSLVSLLRNSLEIDF